VRHTKRESEISKCLVPVYYVTREPNGATFVNYLSCGRFTYADSRLTL
jgi:hypothetical protein